MNKWIKLLIFSLVSFITLSNTFPLDLYQMENDWDL